MFQAALTQEAAEDGSTVVVSMQGPLCFANAQRIKERLIQFSVRASSSLSTLQLAGLEVKKEEMSPAFNCVCGRGFCAWTVPAALIQVASCCKLDWRAVSRG